MLGEGKSVGREYLKASDVWAADEQETIGLLRLMLLELRKANRKLTDPLDAHRDWLNKGKPAIDAARLTVKSHERRVGRFCNFRKLLRILGVFLNKDHEWDARRYRSHPKWFWSDVERLHEAAKTLKKIKRQEDLVKIKGIGPATARKLCSDPTNKAP